jgi:predicted RecB family endonuclease
MIAKQRQHVVNLLHGPEHEYWKLRVAAQLRSSGYEVAVDEPIGGGETIDLVATRNTERLAVEIEAGMSDVLAHVRRCVAAGYASIHILATRSAVASQLRRVLHSAECPSTVDISVVDALRFVQTLASPVGR